MKLFHGSNVEIKEVDFGTLTNQFTFHTEKALNYLRRVGVEYDK